MSIYLHEHALSVEGKKRVTLIVSMEGKSFLGDFYFALFEFQTKCTYFL